MSSNCRLKATTFIMHLMVAKDLSRQKRIGQILSFWIYACLKKLREKDWGGSIKVFILTNISRDEAPSSLRVMNVDRYVVKAHHTPSQIVEMIEETLSKQAKTI